jgi:succinate dehydrogenase/fumarate reductase flavoprotein subunit
VDETLTYDVVVVGGGGSGLAAAVSCIEGGLRVLLLEKHEQLGGTTGIAIGSFTANGTRFQQRAGIDDSFSDHDVDAGKFAEQEIEARNNSSLRKYFLSHTAETLHWLADKGLAFHGPSPEPPNRVPRMHNVVPNAKAYVATLHSALIRGGGHVQCGCEVVELVVNENRIQGVVARRQNGELLHVTAQRAVVLASGDYAASSELISTHKGEQFAAIEGINSRAVGDGHRLVDAVGGQLLNMDVTYGPEIRFVPPPSRHGGFTQLLPTSGPFSRLLGKLLPLAPKFLIQSFIKRLLVTWQHPEDSLFDDGAILINQRGDRFTDERDWPAREVQLAQQPEKIGYILLDEALIERYSQWPHFISTAPEIAYAYVNDYLRLRADVAAKSNSVEQLARLRNIPADNLIKTIERYNESAHAKSRRQLSGTEWALLGPVKAYFTTTEGGAAISQQLEVLSASGERIPGLYAVGQIGLGGQILWGHGLHIAWAMTSGRLVGMHLAELNSRDA